MLSSFSPSHVKIVGSNLGFQRSKLLIELFEKKIKESLLELTSKPKFGMKNRPLARTRPKTEINP
jgi:hypothetical protein